MGWKDVEEADAEEGDDREQECLTGEPVESMDSDYVLCKTSSSSSGELHEHYTGLKSDCRKYKLAGNGA